MTFLTSSLSTRIPSIDNYPRHSAHWKRLCTVGSENIESSKRQTQSQTQGNKGSRNGFTLPQNISTYSKAILPFAFTAPTKTLVSSGHLSNAWQSQSVRPDQHPFKSFWQLIYIYPSRCRLQSTKLAHWVCCAAQSIAWLKIFINPDSSLSSSLLSQYPPWPDYNALQIKGMWGELSSSEITR